MSREWFEAPTPYRVVRMSRFLPWYEAFPESDAEPMMGRVASGVSADHAARRFHKLLRRKRGDFAGRVVGRGKY